MSSIVSFELFELKSKVPITMNTGSQIDHFRDRSEIVDYNQTDIIQDFGKNIWY